MQFGKDVRRECCVLCCLSAIYSLSGTLTDASRALPEMEDWRAEQEEGYKGLA